MRKIWNRQSFVITACSWCTQAPSRCSRGSGWAGTRPYWQSPGRWPSQWTWCPLSLHFTHLKLVKRIREVSSAQLCSHFPSETVKSHYHQHLAKLNFNWIIFQVSHSPVPGMDAHLNLIVAMLVECDRREGGRIRNHFFTSVRGFDSPVSGFPGIVWVVLTDSFSDLSTDRDWSGLEGSFSVLRTEWRHQCQHHTQPITAQLRVSWPMRSLDSDIRPHEPITYCVCASWE